MNLTVAAIISGFLIVLGTVGSIVPIVPGIPAALIGLIIYGFATHFVAVTVLGLMIFSALTLLTIVLDVFGPGLAAKGYKSSRTGAWGAILGGIFGIFILGPIGVLVGPFLGGFLGELLASGNHERSLKTAWAAFVGQMIGWAFKLSVGIAMFIYLMISIFKA